MACTHYVSVDEKEREKCHAVFLRERIAFTYICMRACVRMCE